MSSLKAVDVVIIGAGTAGLSAMKEVRKITENYRVIDRGPLGTTCSRVGCMPSKILLQFAHDYRSLRGLQKKAVYSADNAAFDHKLMMNLLRAKRDHFLGYALAEIKELGDHFMSGQARFVGPGHIKIDDGQEIKAKKIIIATGSSPIVPKEWAALGERIITTDNFFELKDLGKSWGVIGMGPIGLEIGQALSWLEFDVHGFDKGDGVAGLKDPPIRDKALEAFQRDFPIKLGAEVRLESAKQGITIKAGSESKTVDYILAAMGRRPNVESLDLKNAGCELDAKGLPHFSLETMAVKGSNLFIAGDVDGVRPILHESADDGRIAGYNAVREVTTRFKRRVGMAIGFTTPQFGNVGKAVADLKDPVIGEVSFENQGRSVILEENVGMLRVYAEAKTGKLLGAEFLSPRGEHLAHILATAIEQGATVLDMLRVPFYHPTVEEGLRTALKDARGKLWPDAKPGLDLDILKN